MNKDKWNQIVSEELQKTNGESINTPENWDKNRKVILDFVKSIDEATEVYFLENNETQK